MSVHQENWQLKKYRHESLEIRRLGETGNRFEVLHWGPNVYYGRQEEYVWNPQKARFQPHNSSNCYIHPNCFENPETACVVAFLTMRNRRDLVMYKIDEVDDRVKSLSQKNIEIFNGLIVEFLGDWDDEDFQK